MAEDDIASRMVEALQDTPSMQLDQMRALIDLLLDDPKREMAARMKLHLGQAVQFIDHRTGQVRHGKLIARHDKQATVLEEDVRRTWKIPYVALRSTASRPDPECRRMSRRRSPPRRRRMPPSRSATRSRSTMPRGRR
jgi:hypothetical protein